VCSIHLDDAPAAIVRLNASTHRLTGGEEEIFCILNNKFILYDLILFVLHIANTCICLLQVNTMTIRVHRRFICHTFTCRIARIFFSFLFLTINCHQWYISCKVEIEIAVLKYINLFRFLVK